MNFAVNTKSYRQILVKFCEEWEVSVTKNTFFDAYPAHAILIQELINGIFPAQDRGKLLLL